MSKNYQQFVNKYQGKNVLIMGLGLQGGGLGDANFFSEIGARVTVTDLKSKTQLKPSLAKLRPGIKTVLGQHREADFKNAQLIVKNPGVPNSSKFLKIARKKQVPVRMSTSLFASWSPAKIIGITGTRGKSTTTEMIYQVCQKLNKKVWLGGNVLGVATLPLLKKVEASDLVVLELSSWELSGFHQEKFSPHIAVFTNFYPDHLNRYSSMTDYVNDKKAIFLYQKPSDFLVINQEDPTLKKLAQEAVSNLVFFSRDDWPAEWSLKLKGEHNQENAAAVLKVAKILGLKKAVFKKTIGQFKGLPHRLELVEKIDGVEYINDTTSTTPTATIKALAAFNKPIVLILGGNQKNLPTKKLIQALKKAKNLKTIVLLDGSATQKLKADLKKVGLGKVTSRVYSNFYKAIKKASQLAQAGEVVLLSPGFTSFAMFANEFDRGRQFKKIVSKIKDASQT